MKFLQVLSALAILCSSANSYGTEDTPENRVVQVQRYLAAVPPDELFDDMAANVSMNFPPAERAAVRKFMTEYVDISRLTKAMEASMIKHFTAEELQALADFYGSPVGQSAMSKFGVYMAEIMPVFESEIARALGEFQDTKASGNRTSTDLEQ